MDPIKVKLRKIVGELQDEKAKAQKMAQLLPAQRPPHCRGSFGDDTGGVETALQGRGGSGRC